MEQIQVNEQELNQVDLVPSAVQEFDFQNQVEMDITFGFELPVTDFSVVEFDDLGLTDL